MAGHDHTTVIQGWVDRLQAGDGSARGALLGCACDRLTRLSRKMLRDNPAVARWEQTDDVLQNALIRLDRAVRSVAPPTARDFFRLAAAVIRRELIDLARHHKGRAGSDPSDPSAGVPELTHEPGRLAEWTEFHRRVGSSLGRRPREAFDLLYYQAVDRKSEAATVLGVSERTVNRRVDQGEAPIERGPSAANCPHDRNVVRFQGRLRC